MIFMSFRVQSKYGEVNKKCDEILHLSCRDLKKVVENHQQVKRILQKQIQFLDEEKIQSDILLTISTQERKIMETQFLASERRVIFLQLENEF